MEAKFFEVTQFQNIQTVSPIYVPIFGNNYSREDSDTTITVRSLYKQYLTSYMIPLLSSSFVMVIVLIGSGLESVLTSML